MERVLTAVLLAALLGGPALAQDEIKNPDWIRRPTAAQLRAVVPLEARKTGKGGRATISCRTTVQGALADCRVIAETPPGAGFGEAALLMAPQFLIRPATRNGVPFEGTVRIPMKFEGGDEDPFAGEARIVVRPTMAWERAPTRAEVVAAYPEPAKGAGVTGVVGLQCAFNYLRTLNNCRVLAEEPRGQGFGKAAQAVAARFVSAPFRPGGKALSTAVMQLTITFSPDLLKGDVVLGKPSWATLPSDEALDRAFSGLPAEVSSVLVVMRCRVEQGGALADCRLVSEEPAGQGIGQRALQLTPEFRLGTWTTDGLPVVGDWVNLPLRYNPPKS